MWEKTLGFNASLLNKLLADDAFPADIKKKLASLKRVVTSYPQLYVRRRSGAEE
jgi:hypothetical protein